MNNNGWIIVLNPIFVVRGRSRLIIYDDLIVSKSFIAAQTASGAFLKSSQSLQARM